MIPVSPAARTNGFIRLRTRLDSHIWYPAIVLPFDKVLLDKILHKTLTLEIIFSYRAKLIVIFLTFRLETHPVDCIESLLKNISWPRFEFVFLPRPKPVGVRTVFLPVIAT